MDSLYYGVNGMIGDYLVVKLKVSHYVWTKIELLLIQEKIQYTASKLYIVKDRPYTKFTALLTPWMLKRVKIIVREVRIQKIQQEVEMLKLF